MKKALLIITSLLSFGLVYFIYRITKETIKIVQDGYNHIEE